MTETLGHGCSSVSTQQELCNDYQLDRVYVYGFKIIWTKVASALEGLREKKHEQTTLLHGPNGRNINRIDTSEIAKTVGHAVDVQQFSIIRLFP